MESLGQNALNELSDSQWIAIVKVIFDSSMKEINALGIPIVKGAISGSGTTLINLRGMSLLECQSLLTDGSISVIDEIYDVERDDGSLIGFHLYMRLGQSNTWIYRGLSREEPEDTEYDDNDDELPDVDPSTIERVATVVASSPGFGELRNKRQRRDFTKSIASQELPADSGEFYISEIADCAETIYELGIIPMKSKRLKGVGKTVDEIAKEIGISKQRAERAINADIPRYIIDHIRTAGIEP